VKYHGNKMKCKNLKQSFLNSFHPLIAAVHSKYLSSVMCTFICGVGGKGLGLNNLKYFGLKFEFVNTNELLTHLT
jgi:hypothetical protein